MNPTLSDAGRTATAAPRSAGSQAMRAAGRQLLSTAGNQVLKAAVDRAVDKVDQTAGRLDAFAARPARPASASVERTSPKPAEASDEQPARGGAVRAKVGASLDFVVQRAILLLQLIQRLARQLLDALARLVDRVKGSGRDEEGQEQTAADDTPPETGRGTTEDGPRGSDGSAAAQRSRPPQSPRRRQAPGSLEAPVRRRREADRPRRTATDG